MALTLNFKDGIDLPYWRPVAVFPISASGLTNAPWGPGTVTTSDNRSRKYAHPEIFTYASSTDLWSYNSINDGWIKRTSPSLAATFSNGVDCIFVPSQGFQASTVAASSTTTVINTSGVLQNSASVVTNQLANRGDGLGFLVRIIGKTSGKIEERRIIGNTSGTTPTLYLDQALSFTPAVGDGIEYLGGRVYMLNTGTAQTGMFKYYDVLTGTINSTALAFTNLPTITTTPTNILLSLDESHVPYSRYPGEGFVVGTSTYDSGVSTPTVYTKKCLVATATTNTTNATITGQATAGDASVLANEYRNFQIRIVEDTTNPTAVGQRKKITSHTAGPSAVYTLNGTFTVAPSATCKFVIENDNDKMLFFASGSTSVYNYNHTANTWDTSTWGAASVAHSGGFVYQYFGVDVAASTTGKQVRNSHIMLPRGGGTMTYDIFDISGGATGTWTSGLTFPGVSIPQFLSTSTSANYIWVYVSNANEGKYVYISGHTLSNYGSNQLCYRLDLITKTIEAFEAIPATYGYYSNNATTNAATTGNKAGMYLHVDSSGSVIPAIYFARVHGNTGEWFQLLIPR